MAKASKSRRAKAAPDPRGKARVVKDPVTGALSFVFDSPTLPRMQPEVQFNSNCLISDVNAKLWWVDVNAKTITAA